MRQHITACLCAAGVAATLSVFAEDYYLGVDEWGQAVYGTLEQYQARLTAKFQAVENIESAAAQTKAKIDALWESSKDLVTGLTTTKSDFETALSELNDTAAEWEAWIEDHANYFFQRNSTGSHVARRRGRKPCEFLP